MERFQVDCLDGADGLGNWLGSLECGNSRLMAVATALRRFDSRAGGLSQWPTADNPKHRHPGTGSIHRCLSARPSQNPPSNNGRSWLATVAAAMTQTNTAARKAMEAANWALSFPS